MAREIISVDLGKDLKQHVVKTAKMKKLSPSLFVREVLKKYTHFKEKELV